jgi:hypothetical protein
VDFRAAWSESALMTHPPDSSRKYNSVLLWGAATSAIARDLFAEMHGTLEGSAAAILRAVEECEARIIKAFPPDDGAPAKRRGLKRG